MLNRLLHTVPAGPLHTVDRFLADGPKAQERVLRRILTKARATEWGRRLGFGDVLRAPDIIAAYQDRVSLHEYDSFHEDFQRVRRGVPDVVWPGRFRDFAVSSGTASAGKVLPVSREMLIGNRSFSLAVGLNYLAETGNLRFIQGKHLTLPGRIEESPDHPGTFVGEVSGLQAEYAPAFFRRFLQAVPNEIAFLPNWEQKLAAIADRTLHMDIRTIVMVPSWALAFFKLLVQQFRRKTGRRVETVGEVWPNLQLFISGGVSLASYRTLLESLIGLEHLHFIETYGASEGFFAFQSSVADRSMLLHLDNGVFFEFVRMDEHGSPSPRRFTVADVEPDVRYTLYVSTCSGLWAYNVRDVVRFTSTYPHKIVVVGRTSEMIDKYGEAVFGEEAGSALREACRMTEAEIAYFHIAPRPAALDRMPSHQWLIEFDRMPRDKAAFVETIDAYLQKVNRHYQIRREARVFDQPEIVSLPEGTFYGWLQRTKKQVSGQTKVPRMSEERGVADEILKTVTHLDIF